MKFDKYEWQILQSLQQNGQITNQQLAEKIGLSATPCWRRLNALNQRGVIKKYVALLDQQKVGIGEIVYAHINVDQQDTKAIVNFEDAIHKRSEIMECYASMGEADYLLKVAVPDIAAYDRLLHKFLFKIPGVIQVHSNFVLRPVKQSTALPLDVYTGFIG